MGKLREESSLFQIISMAVVLSVLWLLLSGHYNPLLIGLGAASVVLTLIISVRMNVTDREGHPIHLACNKNPPSNQAEGVQPQSQSCAASA